MKKIILIMFAACLFFSCILSGCSKTSPPDKVLESKLKAVKKGDFTVFATSKEDKDRVKEEYDDETYKALYSGLKYDVVSTDINGDTAVVSVTITTVDAKKAINQYVKEAFGNIGEKNWDSDGSEFKKILTSGEDNTVTSTVNVNMTKTKDGWVIDKDNDDLYNALTGGLYDFSKAMSKNKAN